jgi:hypothetical protein
LKAHAPDTLKESVPAYNSRYKTPNQRGNFSLSVADFLPCKLFGDLALVANHTSNCRVKARESDSRPMRWPIRSRAMPKDVG